MVPSLGVSNLLTSSQMRYAPPPILSESLNSTSMMPGPSPKLFAMILSPIASLRTNVCGLKVRTPGVVLLCADRAITGLANERAEERRQRWDRPRDDFHYRFHLRNASRIDRAVRGGDRLRDNYAVGVQLLEQRRLYVLTTIHSHVVGVTAIRVC